MAVPVTIVSSGGLPVTESTNGFGVPLTPKAGAAPVTIVASRGIPVIFMGENFELWPGGVDPTP